MKNIFKTVRLFLTLSLVTISFFANADELAPPFTTNDVQAALNQARTEGKLVFLDFSAKWCTPCLYMEETTFKDKRVSNKLSDKYVAVKVDVDQSAGKQIKKEFGVKFLPTIMIIDANGSTLKKIEETVTADELVTVLDTYQNTSTGHSTTRKVIKKAKQEDSFSISREDYLNYSRMEEKKTNYRVQLGVYSKFEAAQRKSDEIKKIFIDPIIILEEKQNGKTLYKVLLGNFSSLGEAKSFSEILRKDFNMDSIIK